MQRTKWYPLVFGCVLVGFLIVLFMLWSPLKWHWRVMEDASMAPHIKKNSLVLVRRDAHAVQLGKIIEIHTRAGDHAIRRVVGQQGTSVLTKGDAGTHIDLPILASQVDGQVQFVIPMAGLFTKFVRSVPGLALCIYVPVVTIIAYELHVLAQKRASYSLYE